MVSQTVRVLYEDFKDIDTLRQSNVAMANPPLMFIMFPLKSLFIADFHGFPIAMFDYPRVNLEKV